MKLVLAMLALFLVIGSLAERLDRRARLALALGIVVILLLTRLTF
jgi:hypothetical protein